MKHLALVLGALGASLLGAESPSTNATAALRAVPASLPPKVETTLTPSNPKAGTTTYGGVLAQASSMDQPLQLLNPLAPARYGDGSQNLAVDPLTGKPQGVTLFSISFHKPSKKKAQPAAGK